MKKNEDNLILRSCPPVVEFIRAEYSVIHISRQHGFASRPLAETKYDLFSGRVRIANSSTKLLLVDLKIQTAYPPPA
jgi:hypothetical protein